jgi:xanthine dehydrogenase accessory factor
MIEGKQANYIERLIAERRPFVLATVVGARRPTSARPGATAVILSDGTIDGFIGGVCAESSVRLYSLRAMETGEPLLLRLVPGDGEAGGASGDSIEGAVVEHNPCLSGGSLAIFLEPRLPMLRVVVIGGSPIAEAIAQLAQAAGYDSSLSAVGDTGDIGEAAAVIVAAHGNGEEAVLAAALTAGVPYVALVASPKRGAIVRAELDVPAELSAQLHTPAGLNIGARSPNEIAISVLAEMVSEYHADPYRTHPPRPMAEVTASPVTAAAVDPVCGMQVAITGATPQLQIAGERVFFCCDGCRDRYAAQHAGDVGVRSDAGSAHAAQPSVDRDLDLVGHFERAEQRRVRLHAPGGLLDGGAPGEAAVIADLDVEGDQVDAPGQLQVAGDVKAPIAVRTHGGGAKRDGGALEHLLVDRLRDPLLVVVAERLDAAGALQHRERGGVGGQLQHALRRVSGQLGRRAPALDGDQEIVAGLGGGAALGRADRQGPVAWPQLIRSRLDRHRTLSQTLVTSRNIYRSFK